MRNRRIQLAASAVFGALVLSGLSVVAQQQAQEPPPMGFFITSTGLGDGANLGGLDGADAHCQTLAAAVGASDRTWQAYLSTQGPGAVNARDRIGDGPWANAEGLVMATGVESLHFDNSNFNWTHTLDENGDQFPSRIDGDPRLHGARRADRHTARRHGVSGGRRPHLRQLDQQWRRQRHARPRRPLLLHDAGFALEHRPPVTRLLAGQSGGYGRGRPVLLLRHRLMDVRGSLRRSTAQTPTSRTGSSRARRRPRTSRAPTRGAR